RACIATHASVAWSLGTGRGGIPYLALLSMRRLYRAGTVVRLMDPMDLADDALVAIVSNMGAPLVGQERLTDPRTIERAVRMMEEYRSEERRVGKEGRGEGAGEH